MIDQINKQLAAEGKRPFQRKTVHQGAATSVWASVVPAADEVGGHYCENCHVGNIVPADVAHHRRQRRSTRVCAGSKYRRGAVSQIGSVRIDNGGMDPRVLVSLGSEAQCALDEVHLTKNVGLRQPADLPLTDDVRCVYPAIVFSARQRIGTIDWPWRASSRSDDPARGCCSGRVLVDTGNCGPIHRTASVPRLRLTTRDARPR
jgi:hypothetical protein